MTVLLMIAVLSLALPLRLQTSFALLRPFEALVALAMIGWPLVAMRRGVRVPEGFVLLLPYFAWYLYSTTVGGIALTAREGLQLTAVTMFAFLLSQEAPRLDISRVSRSLLWGLAAIGAGTILWHVTHGYVYGWKRLTDARLVFVFLPTLLAGLILFADAKTRRTLWFVWVGLSPLLVMSGERKALLIYVALTALLLARGRMALLAPAIVAVFVGLFVLSTMISNPYLQRQIRSLTDPGKTGNYSYFFATGQYAPGDTPSDVERAFAFHISKQILEKHPLTGVGTNQYVEVLDKTFPQVPESLRLGIHGEFQRVLTENGLIGLALYLLIWVASWVRLSRVLRRVIRDGRLTKRQARVIPLLFFVPLAIFLGTEAPGTRAFVGLILISLLPELVHGALARAPNRAPVQLTIIQRLQNVRLPQGA